MMIRPIMILKVNKTSSKKGGSGSINIDNIKRTSRGTPKLESSNFDMSCRMFDSSALAINVDPSKIKTLKALDKNK